MDLELMVFTFKVLLVAVAVVLVFKLLKPSILKKARLIGEERELIEKEYEVLSDDELVDILKEHERYKTLEIMAVLNVSSKRGKSESLISVLNELEKSGSRLVAIKAREVLNELSD